MTISTIVDAQVSQVTATKFSGRYLAANDSVDFMVQSNSTSINTVAKMINEIKSCFNSSDYDMSNVSFSGDKIDSKTNVSLKRIILRANKKLINLYIVNYKIHCFIKDNEF